jgi:hypothetical protein
VAKPLPFEADRGWLDEFLEGEEQRVEAIVRETEKPTRRPMMAAPNTLSGDAVKDPARLDSRSTEQLFAELDRLNLTGFELAAYARAAHALELQRELGRRLKLRRQTGAPLTAAEEVRYSRVGLI